MRSVAICTPGISEATAAFCTSADMLVSTASTMNTQAIAVTKSERAPTL